jgi:hypothetical protein
MLPRGAVMGGVVVVVVAFYCKLYNVQLLRDEAVLLQQLKQSHRQAQEPVLLMLGECCSSIHLATTLVTWTAASLLTSSTPLQGEGSSSLPQQPGRFWACSLW